MTSGELEIRTFVPPACLQGKEIGAMEIEEFARYLGMARHVEELWMRILNKAIAETFSAEE